MSTTDQWHEPYQKRAVQSQQQCRLQPDCVQLSNVNNSHVFDAAGWDPVPLHPHTQWAGEGSLNCTKAETLEILRNLAFYNWNRKLACYQPLQWFIPLPAECTEIHHLLLNAPMVQHWSYSSFLIELNQYFILIIADTVSVKYTGHKHGWQPHSIVGADLMLEGFITWCGRVSTQKYVGIPGELGRIFAAHLWTAHSVHANCCSGSAVCRKCRRMRACLLSQIWN